MAAKPINIDLNINESNFSWHLSVLPSFNYFLLDILFSAVVCFSVGLDKCVLIEAASEF